MSFLSNLFTGSDSTQQGDINNAGQVMGFGTGTGEGAVRTGLGFDEALLSGNEAEQARLLAPEIEGIQKRGQQQIQTTGEFGNRSGGTNASAQTNIDTQRAQVNDMISKLTGDAAGRVTQTGENLLNTGLQANELQNQEEQQKMENQQNSLLGGIVSKGVSGALGFVPGLNHIF